MRPTKATESARIAREHLIQVLLEQILRTYGMNGGLGMLRVVADLLRRLDDTALRDYAYSQGLTSEQELEPEDETGRERPAGETS
jgi:hypothetical protein